MPFAEMLKKPNRVICLRFVSRKNPENGLPFVYNLRRFFLVLHEVAMKVPMPEKVPAIVAAPTDLMKLRRLKFFSFFELDYLQSTTF